MRARRELNQEVPFNSIILLVKHANRKKLLHRVRAFQEDRKVNAIPFDVRYANRTEPLGRRRR